MFSENLKTLRKQKGFSQEELPKKVPDILTGKLFRVLFHVIKEIRNIVFVAVNGTLFKVTDFSSFLKL